MKVEYSPTGKFPVPFGDFNGSIDKFYDAGNCYTGTTFLDTSITPPGYYTSRLYLYDEFGSNAYCLQMMFYVRKAPRLSGETNTLE